jgi:hypothetical protein
MEAAGPLQDCDSESPRHRPKVDQISKSASWLARHNMLLTGAAACIAPALYLLFVIHYSMNVLLFDDWNVVPLIHAALHGHLTFSALWAQHNENRMLFPNLIFVELGILTHDDAKVTILLSAVLFVATYFLFLAMFRSYLGLPLTPLSVLAVGAVWFSLCDWQNALWGFQFAWYLILFLLIVMLYLLLVTTSGFVLALLAAIIASFSSVQGLELWPVGLVCIAWTVPSDSRRSTDRKKTEVLVWLGAAIGAIGVYFWGYTATSSNFALHHPVSVAEYILIEIGEVIPNTDSRSLWLNGLLGTGVLAVAVLVVIQSVRHRRGGRNCLPVALIVFGLMFDLFTAVGRVALGVSIGAQSSRYTMANLLVLLGIITYAWVHLRDNRRSVRIFASVGIILVAAQLAVATNSGIASARTLNQQLVIGARLVVNLSDVPAQKERCYSLYGVSGYVYPTFGFYLRYPGFAEAQEDRLSVFSSGLLQRYRSEGLPNISQCRAR